MFRANFSSWDMKIEQIVTGRVTAKTVTPVNGRREHKESFNSYTCHKWTDTRQEAYDWLIKLARTDIEKAEAKLKQARKGLKKVEALK